MFFLKNGFVLSYFFGTCGKQGGRYFFKAWYMAWYMLLYHLVHFH